MIIKVKDLVRQIEANFGHDTYVDFPYDELVGIQSAPLKRRKISGAAVYDLYDQGFGQTEIGKRLKCSKQAVQFILNKRIKKSPKKQRGDGNE